MSPSSSDRALGLLLFLPVPIVLALLVRSPLGFGLSLLLGVAIMATHRLYARPFAITRAGRRCLWCGSALREPVSLSLTDPLGPAEWAACGQPHANASVGVVAFAQAHAAEMKLGILGSLAVLLVITAAAALGFASAAVQADAVALFQLSVALSVLRLAAFGPSLGAGLAASRGGEGGVKLRSPFPLHIQALIGSAAVLWLFRIAGVVWLVQSLLHGASRFGWLAA